MTARFLVAASVLWVAAIVLAPRAIASGHAAVSLAAAGVYAGGARICHQRPDRCYWIDGRPMPVCARCTGLYAGAAVAGSLAWVWSAGLAARRARRLAAIAALPTLLTWSIEMAGWVHPGNTVRFAAALPLGAVTAWLVITTINQSPRRERTASQ